MTKNTDLCVGPASGWQLQAEFWSSTSCCGNRQLVALVTETMQESGLQCWQLERIQKAILEATQTASLRRRPTQLVSPVHIRIWAADECARGHGWGFFLVERPASHLQGAPVEKEHLVELFLYQERHS